MRLDGRHGRVGRSLSLRAGGEADRRADACAANHAEGRAVSESAGEAESFIKEPRAQQL